MKRLVTFVLAAGILFSASAQVRTSLTAADVKGQISFMSVDRFTTPKQIAKGRADVSDVISGQIAFPGSGFFGGGVKATPDHKVAAMVIMHSSSGVTKAVTDWADYLNSLGVATFVVDSFTTRGIARTAEDQSQMGRFAGGADALMALKLLATHPLIDSTRIGVMGFSRGGTATQIASFESIRIGLFGKDSNQMFAGHIAFYGGCAIAGKTTGKPILMLSGEAEDYQPAANCIYVKEIMASLGANIAIKTYPGAYHGFDTDLKVAYRPNVQTASKCVVIKNIDADTAYAKDSPSPLTPMSEQDAEKFTCGPGKGAHSGNNSEAARKSKEDVRQFVADYLTPGK